MLIHKYAYSHNGWQIALCGAAYEHNRNKRLIRIRKDVTCSKCNSKKSKIKDKLLKALKNLD